MLRLATGNLLHGDDDVGAEVALSSHTLYPQLISQERPKGGESQLIEFRLRRKALDGQGAAVIVMLMSATFSLLWLEAYLKTMIRFVG